VTGNAAEEPIGLAGGVAWPANVHVGLSSARSA